MAAVVVPLRCVLGCLLLLCVCWCPVAAGLLGLPGHVGVRGGVRGGGAPRGLLRRPRVHGPLPVLRVLLAGGWGPMVVIPCRGT